MALLDHTFSEPLSGSELGTVDLSARDLSAGRSSRIETPVHSVIYRSGVKRLLDIVLVLATAPFWLPIIAITAFFVARDGHNPFYTQPRIGMNGRVFRILKLRSMVHNADAVFEAYLRNNPAAQAEWNAAQKLKDDPRITRVGSFIRKTSIDELPQLFNVLFGHMSLVGPRPMMVSQKPLYPGHRYYQMRPGITGFWQVSNRNHCRFSSRARYDDAYFKALSLPTDLTVIWRTIGVVLRGTGY